MTAPDWAASTPSTAGVHTPPASSYQRTNLDQNQLRILRQKLLESIFQVLVQALRGLFVPGGLGSAQQQLEEWVYDLEQQVGEIPVVGGVLQDLIEILSGVEDGDTTDVGTWVNNLDDNITDFLERMVGVGPGMVSDATVGSHATNLLLNALFDTADTVAEEGGWVWDGTTGKTTNGSAKATANGSERVMLSNRIQVVEDDTLDVSVWAKCSSLSYTGSNPIALGVTKYDSSMSLVGSTDVVSWASPGATEDWTELSGSYTVPAGVGYLRLRLKVASTASSGSVWFDEASATKTGGVRDVSVPGIGTILTNVMLGLEDLTGVDVNHDGALGSFQSTAASLRANASAITYLQSLQTGGVSAVDDFERDDSDSMGANWDQDYSGSGAGDMETDGHAVIWDRSGFGQRSCIARFTGTPSTSNTDVQRIVVVLGSKGQYHEFQSKAGYNYLYGRMSTDNSHYIRATFGADGEVSLGYAAGSGYVQWATTDTTAPGIGATLWLDCGKSGDSRWYCAYINESPILTYDETGTSSSLGASYRGWGCGMLAEGGTLLAQQIPAKLNSWAAWDL